ncbi:MAG: RDD family protein [Syntrophales bacterium]|nr:RDD family protein [Syntrophales bacterium]
MNNHYGGFWRRCLAFLIDQIILYSIYLVFFLMGLLFYALGHLAQGDMFSPGAPPDMASWFMILYWGAVVIVTALYFTCFVAVTGQTPGKMVLGLKVVPVERGIMTFGMAFLRWVGYIVSSFFFYLGFVWIAFDPRKQGWHDKIAGTVVVRASRGAVQP